MSDMIKHTGGGPLQWAEPSTLEEAIRLSGILYKSRLLPETIKSPEQALTIMIAGHELGFSPMQSFRYLYVLKGKVAMYADGMVALCVRSKNCEYFICTEDTVDKVTYETKRKGAPVVRRTWTTGDAQRARLNGGNYDKFPRAMLRARCKSDLARDVYPDLVAGIYDPDEVQVPAGAIEPPKKEDFPVNKADKLQEAKPSVEEAEYVTTTLSDVIMEMQESKTEIDLKATVALAALLDEKDKAEAREFYKKRLEEIRSPEGETPAEEEDPNPVEENLEFGFSET